MPVIQPAIRNNYACKSDKSAYLFATTHDALQQHTKRISYQVAMWVHSYDDNGWQLSDGQLEPVMFEITKMRPRKKFKISHISVASHKV